MDLSSKQALAEKAKKWMDQSSANYQIYNHTKNKRAGGKMALKKSVKCLLSEEGKEPYNTLNRTENTVQELSEKMATEKKRAEKKHSNEELYKSGKKEEKKRVTKDRQSGQRRPQQSP